MGLGFAQLAATPGWAHAASCARDPAVRAICREIGIDMSELNFGRIDGAFFTVDGYLHFRELVRRHIDLEGFASSAEAWPVEEVILPMVLARHYGLPSAPRALTITKELSFAELAGAKEADANVVTVEDLAAAVAKYKDPFGMKWFSPRMDDPARQWLNARLYGQAGLKG
jgi:hypothetical protein